MQSMVRSFLAALLLTAACLAQPQPVAIRDVRVFDGKRVFSKATVVFHNGAITAFGKSVEIPASAEVIEGKGKTLLPGLIDAHVHNGNVDTLKPAMMFGVTTEIDLFSDIFATRFLQQQQLLGKYKDRPDLYSAGTPATVPGGHGTEYGMRIPTLTKPEEADPFVEQRVQEGSFVIKIIIDDGSSYGAHTPTLDEATVKALVAAAHKRGKLAVAHIGTEAEARMAILAGVDGLAHLFAAATVSKDFGRFAAEHKVFVIPTLSVLSSLCHTPDNASLASDPRLGPALTEAEMAQLRSSFPSQGNCAALPKEVKQLADAGVPILAGSDVPNPGTAHGVSMHGELALLVKAGLSPVQALQAATSAPAVAFGLRDRGTIAADQFADLLLVNGDPTSDILATRDMVAVWKKGVKVYRDEYLEYLRKQRDEAEKLRQTPGPPGSESGWIADFEDGKLSARFGAWAPSTDAMVGRNSKSSLEVVPGGAEGSKYALRVSGEIVADFPMAWAGIHLMPAGTLLAPANLSHFKGLSFWTRGDGGTYRVMLYAMNRGVNSITRTFVAGPEWKRVEFAWSDFDGIDGRDVQDILFIGGPKGGRFEFLLDDIRLVAR